MKVELPWHIFKFPVSVNRIVKRLSILTTVLRPVSMEIHDYLYTNAVEGGQSMKSMSSRSILSQNEKLMKEDD